jgi:hypothetical protein
MATNNSQSGSGSNQGGSSQGGSSQGQSSQENPPRDRTDTSYLDTLKKTGPDPQIRKIAGST